MKRTIGNYTVLVTCEHHIEQFEVTTILVDGTSYCRNDNYGCSRNYPTTDQQQAIRKMLAEHNVSCHGIEQTNEYSY